MRGVSKCKGGILPRKDSYMIIYFLPIREHMLPEEDASDFLLWFQSRLEAIERNFEKNKLKKDGTVFSFEEFLSICVRRRCSNYLSERRKKEYIHDIADRFYYNNNCQSESSCSCVSDVESAAESYYSKTRARQSRLTTMILMHAPFIEYSEAIRMAEVCKLDVKQFITMYESVRSVYSRTYGERTRRQSERHNLNSLRSIIEKTDTRTDAKHPTRRSLKSEIRRNRFDNVVPLRMVSSAQNIPYNTALSNLRIIRKESEILSRKKKLC